MWTRTAAARVLRARRRLQPCSVSGQSSKWTSDTLCVGLQQESSRTLTRSTAPSWHGSPEEEDRLVERMENEEAADDGFVEEEPEDLTVPVLYEALNTASEDSSVSLASPSSSSGPSTSSTQGLSPPQPPALMGAAPAPAGSSVSSTPLQVPAPALGPNSVPGWDKVQDLAEYLVSLREALYLEEQQVTEVIHLWAALPDGDMRRLHYQPRHQPKLAHGRFKAPRNTGVTPGVDSVKRCLIGHPGGPAQWPSTSRLVEAMCIQLCSMHRSPTKKAGVRLPRWTKVLTDYHHVRDLVLDSQPIMEATPIQLFVLNQRTLTQWFNRRENNQELSILTQGLTTDDRIAVASSELPALREPLGQTPSTSGAKHDFVLPPNRAGQAPKLRPGRRPASAAHRPGSSTGRSWVKTPVPAPVRFSADRCRSSVSSSCPCSTSPSGGRPSGSSAFIPLHREESATQGRGRGRWCAEEKVH